MPNEPEKNIIPTNKPTLHTMPIDLAQNKVIVKPANDNSKMSIQPTTFRTIQQQPQMRVVRMPSAQGGAQIIQTQIMPQTILKPQMPGRSTITVSKSPATYLPRVTATLNTIQGTKGTQQIRTPTPPSSVAGIPPSFVRTSITPRTSSPNAVLSQGTTAWVSGGNAMQVQMPQQIIRSTINTQNRTITANIFGQSQQPTISVSTSSSGTSGQPTYVATVLPQRPQGATIVYTSQQQQPFIQGQVQRMGIATATNNTRQIRPIQRIPTTGIRVNASTLSIRQNVPGLAPTTVLTTQTRNSGLAASTSISNTIPARIFQVQSQPSGGQQVITQNPKILMPNVMLPIIVNNNRITSHTVKNPMQQNLIAHVSKLTSGSVSSDGSIISTSLTNTMPSISNTMVASIQPNHSVQSQISQGNQQGTIYTTQTGQSGNQIITVSQQQQQQMINNQQNLHQGNVQTVVPLTLGSRNTNIPIKTITVSASNSGSMDSAVTVHRNLTANTGNLPSTTIMPIGKLVSQQQVVNSQQNMSGGQITNQGTPVYIHTRIPASSSGVSSIPHSQVISVSTSSNSAPTFSNSGAPTATVYYEQASLSSGNADNKATSSTTNNESGYAVASSPNVRYSEKMIHSIITSSFQHQNALANASHIQQQQQQQSNQSSVPVRFSPLVVENQSVSQAQQQAAHQIISLGAGGIVHQQPGSSTDSSTHMIVPVLHQVPTSPRGPALRKQNETTPNKGPKKQPKLSQTRVPPRQQISASVAQLTHNVKLDQKSLQLQQLHSTASSPKTVFSERESPTHVDDWSDGSTTVSIPNSPRSEDDELDAMIMSNQYNKMSDDYTKYNSKTPTKMGSGHKREAGDHHGTPRTKKLKQ